MPIAPDELARLNVDYQSLTGAPVRRFVCPITLQDDPGAELCKGHVLNDGIKSASKATVVQRKDVDNHFGATIEPDLVRFLNTPVSTPEELFRHVRELTVTLPSGDRVEGFFASKKASPPLPRVDLLGADGRPVASPFLRTDRLEPKLHKNLQVEWRMLYTDSAMVGAFLKAAYLALFRLLGYRWVFDVAGDKVRRALEAFYLDGADKAASVEYFAEFRGSLKVLLSDVPEDLGDTLDGGIFLLHFAADPTFPILFAKTCLFRVNARVVSVTLPATEKDRYYFLAYERYQALLQQGEVPQSVHLTRFVEDRFEVDPRPIQFRSAPRPGATEAGLADPQETSPTPDPIQCQDADFVR